MKVKTVMTPCPYTIEADATAEKALEKMKLYNIRQLPVVEEDNLVGVVTERDLNLTTFVSRSVGYEPPLGEICRSDPFVVNANDDLAEITFQMAERKYEYALVVDEDMQFVGIFTTTDVCSVLYRLLKDREL